MNICFKTIIHVTLFLSSISSINSFAQSQLNDLEIELQQIQKELYLSDSDADKLEINKRFKMKLEEALELDGSFEYAFDSLKQMAKLSSPDKLFRLFNWDLPHEDGSFSYYGYILYHHKKKDEYKLIELIDDKSRAARPEAYSSDNRKWFGMLYYKIVVKKHRRKTHYILLGFQGNNRISRKKVIDTMTLNRNGKPQFGVPLLKKENKPQKRAIFEYNKDAFMSLKYNSKEGMVIFDHLAPPNSNLEGQYQFYGPDFSYDAYKYSKGKWEYVKDVDARNIKNFKDNMYNDPKEK